MRKMRLKYKKETVQVIKTLDKYERINYEALKIICSGVIDGIVPLEVQLHHSKVRICAAITNGISLKNYLSFQLSEQEIFRCLSCIVKIGLNCERIGLSAETFQWDWDYVFVDSLTGKLLMLYWPVFDLESHSEQMLKFFQNFLELDAWSGLSKDFSLPVQNYISQRNQIRLQELQDVLSQISERERRIHESEELKKWLMQKETGMQYGAIGMQPGQNLQTTDAWLESLENGDQVMIDSSGSILGRLNPMFARQKSRNSISRKHARIEKSHHSSYYTIEDLNSKYGTYVNGIKLMPGQRVRIEDGMTIQIGACLFVFRQLMSGGTVYVFNQ